MSIKGTAAGAGEGTTFARLAVIESKIDTLLDEIAGIREYIPTSVVEHAQKIVVLERNMRTIQWLGGIFAAAMIGAFLAHVLGG